MKYIVRALESDNFPEEEKTILHEETVEAGSTAEAVIKFMVLAPNCFEEYFDMSDEAVESHGLVLRVLRVEPTDEERMILKTMNEREDSPFKGMIAMPED